MGAVKTEAIRDLIDKIETLLGILKSNGMNINSAYLYGSQACGTAHRDSDIDIAIISDDLSGDSIDDWCNLNMIANRIDVRMEVIGFLPEDFRDENPLAWEIKTKGIKLI
ncbi:TPA: nucleotidyltransferase domain-containing protein [bacterium]|nr:nucleotidyltransferase domain-containing protein [bacterium]